MNIKEVNGVILSLDDSDLVKYQFSDGFNIWVHVRYTVYKKLLSGNSISQSPDPKKSVSKLFALRQTLKNSVFAWEKWNLLFRESGKYDCLIFNSTSACYIARDGILKSRVNDFFSNINGVKSFNFYQKLNGKYGNSYKKPFSYHEIFLHKAELNSKIKSKSFISDRESINLFIENFKNKTKDFFEETFYNDLESQLFYYSKIHYYLARYYKQLFLKFSPKFIVIEDGNYGGGDKTVLVWVANKMGIKTIEVQHGIFDIAFSYGNKLLKNIDFPFFKTSIVLTMGEYWSNFCNIPSRVYTFGYPYLENIINQYSSSNSEDIVFISQGPVTNFLKNIALELRNKIPNRIIYRLHPNEILDNYAELSKNNIEISKNGSVYELINNAKLIIGSYSTVLLEAIMFDKQVLIHDNIYSDEFIPKEVGTRFTSVSDILDNIEIKNNSNLLNNKLWAFNSSANLNAINQIEKLWLP